MDAPQRAFAGNVIFVNLNSGVAQFGGRADDGDGTTHGAQ
jgi:hypothetical protein